MRKISLLSTAALLALGACSTAQLAQTQAEVKAAVPVINAAACDAQAATNLATDALTATHNTADAAASAQASALLGKVCFYTAFATPATTSP